MCYFNRFMFFISCLVLMIAVPLSVCGMDDHTVSAFVQKKNCVHCYPVLPLTVYASHVVINHYSMESNILEHISNKLEYEKNMSIMEKEKEGLNNNQLVANVYAMQYGQINAKERSLILELYKKCNKEIFSMLSKDNKHITDDANDIITRELVRNFFFNSVTKYGHFAVGRLFSLKEAIAAGYKPLLSHDIESEDDDSENEQEDYASDSEEDDDDIQFSDDENEGKVLPVENDEAMNTKQYSLDEFCSLHYRVRGNDADNTEKETYSIDITHSSIGCLCCISQLIGEQDKVKHMAIRGLSSLNKLPIELSQYSFLTTLYITSCGFKKIPSVITFFSNLKELGMNNCNITAINPNIDQLLDLRSLELSGNRITEIPTSICKLTKLHTLDLGGNPIQERPQFLTTMAKLKNCCIDIAEKQGTKRKREEDATKFGNAKI